MYIKLRTIYKQGLELPSPPLDRRLIHVFKIGWAEDPYGTESYLLLRESKRWLVPSLFEPEWPNYAFAHWSALRVLALGGFHTASIGR